MDRIKLTESIVIECSSEEAFDYTQGYDKRLNWDTFLKKAELLGGAISADKGVKAYCIAKNGLGMETEYISYNRPRTTAIKMTRGPYLFKSFLGSWRFKELEDKYTEVIFQYSFQLRFPFNLASLLIKSNLEKNIRQRLSDLKESIENNMTR